MINSVIGSLPQQSKTSTALTTASKPKTSGPAETAEEIAKVKSALHHLSANAPRGSGSFFDMNGEINQEYWLAAVWSIASLGWSCGKEIAKNWSKNSTLFTASGFEQAWNGYKPHLPNAIKIGSLFKAAMAQGWQPTNRQSQSVPPQQHRIQTNPYRSLITQCAADIKPQKIIWLHEGVFPMGMLGIIGGDPGLGKSQIAINLVAIVTTGVNTFDNSTFTNPGSAILLASEDDPARTIVPRLKAAGANLNKVEIVKGVSSESEHIDHFQLESNVNSLREKALLIGDVRIIVIDPPNAYLGAKTDSYKDSDVRRALMPLNALAEETGALILLVVHLNKRSDAGIAQRFNGSTAWIAAPRVAYIVCVNPPNQQRYMLPVKNNLGDDKQGYGFQIKPVTLNNGPDLIRSSKIEWMGKSTLEASSILSKKK